MPCAVGCLALVFPRLAMLLVWLLGPAGYLTRPFPDVFWPVVGFFLLPTTTLAFAYASNSLEPQGDLSAFGWLITVVALLVDLGLLGGGGHSARRRPPPDQDED